MPVHLRHFSSSSHKSSLETASRSAKPFLHRSPTCLLLLLASPSPHVSFYRIRHVAPGLDRDDAEVAAADAGGYVADRRARRGGRRRHRPDHVVAESTQTAAEHEEVLLVQSALVIRPHRMHGFDAGYCYRRRGVLWYVRVSVERYCKPFKTIKMPFGRGGESNSL